MPNVQRYTSRPIARAQAGSRTTRQATHALLRHHAPMVMVWNGDVTHANLTAAQDGATKSMAPSSPNAAASAGTRHRWARPIDAATWRSTITLPPCERAEYAPMTWAKV